MSSKLLCFGAVLQSGRDRHTFSRSAVERHVLHTYGLDGLMLGPGRLAEVAREAELLGADVELFLVGETIPDDMPYHTEYVQRLRSMREVCHTYNVPIHDFREQ